MDLASAQNQITAAQKYRLLTLAQRQVFDELAPRFPRLFIGAPVQMVTTDSGLTYHISGSDADSNAIVPFAHAEVYAESSGSVLYGSSFDGSGDVVFEGSQIRMPNAVARTFTTGPLIRYAAKPETLNASTQPTVPGPVRDLIVPRALVLWCARGGARDPKPYQDMYMDVLWGSDRASGLMASLSTQYAHGNDDALGGINWWRAWLSSQGSPGMSISYGL